MSDAPRPDAVRVFRAGRIISLADHEPEAFATFGEHILEVGSWRDLTARHPHAEPLDLGADAVVVPGFNDAHCHPAGLAESRLRPDLSAASMADGGGSRTILAAGAGAPGTWLIAEGYDPAADPDGRLDRAALDAIVPDRPVAVIHRSYHMVVFNSTALDRAGYDDDTPDPDGGALGRDATGRLDGWAYEAAWFDVRYRGAGQDDLLPAAEPPLLVPQLAAICQRFHAEGITSWCDALVSPHELALYQQARAAGQLTARVGVLVWHAYFEHLRRSGLRSGFGDNRLRLAGIKIIADGALSGGTCLCRQPYRAEADRDNGIQLMSDAALAETVLAVHAAGSRVAVHANGDAAVDTVLKAIEAARVADPDHAATNHRIEHCSMVDDRLVARIRAANVIPVPFGAFVHEHGEKVRGYFGERRARNVCAHRRFLDAGVTVAGSSDYPAGPLPPLRAIATMVTRRTREGALLGPEQRITARQALEAYTVGSAHAAGESHVKGRLVPAMLADFTVLGGDPLRTAPEHIADIPVLATWVGAHRVW